MTAPREDAENGKTTSSEHPRREAPAERERKQHVEQVKRQILEHLLNADPAQWK